MLSNLRDLIPGAELWPRFVRNASDRFEARFSLVKVQNRHRCSLARWRVLECRLRFLMVKVV